MWIKDLEELKSVILLRHKLNDNFLVVAATELDDSEPEYLKKHYSRDAKFRVRFLYQDAFYNRDYDNIVNAANYEYMPARFYHSCFNHYSAYESNVGSLERNIEKMVSHDLNGEDDGYWNKWCIVDLDTLRIFEDPNNPKGPYIQPFTFLSDKDQCAIIMKAFEPLKLKSA